MPASTPPESFAFWVGRLLAQDGEELAYRLSLHPPAYFSSSSRIEYMSWRASPM
jgi:hypothetical protein